MAGKFKFDKYTVSSVGRDVVVQDIPFKVRSKLTLGEKQKASDASVKLSFDEKGTPKLESVDQSEYMAYILKVGILEWPFEDDNDEVVPITVENIKKIDPDILEALFKVVMNVTKVTELAPFVKASEGQ